MTPDLHSNRVTHASSCCWERMKDTMSDSEIISLPNTKRPADEQPRRQREWRLAEPSCWGHHPEPHAASQART